MKKVIRMNVFPNEVGPNANGYVWSEGQLKRLHDQFEKKAKAKKKLGVFLSLDSDKMNYYEPPSENLVGALIGFDRMSGTATIELADGPPAKKVDRMKAPCLWAAVITELSGRNIEFKKIVNFFVTPEKSVRPKKGKKRKGE